MLVPVLWPWMATRAMDGYRSAPAAFMLIWGLPNRLDRLAEPRCLTSGSMSTSDGRTEYFRWQDRGWGRSIAVILLRGCFRVLIPVGVDQSRTRTPNSRTPNSRAPWIRPPDRESRFGRIAGREWRPAAPACCQQRAIRHAGSAATRRGWFSPVAMTLYAGRWESAQLGLDFACLGPVGKLLTS